MKKPVLAVFLALLVLAASAGAQDEDGSVAAMSFVILRDNNGKPVRNASVVLHSVNRHGKQAKGGLELKADADGKCSYDGIPYGTVRVQVLAPGFQTYGQDYDVDKPTIALTIKLKRPEEQYSIYGDQQNDKKEETPPASGAKPK
jgi:Carboxypeptidase regulatory-like domain